ncbi:MAG: hypothetical protein AMXMBFR84_11180 [Candidatus Hydrogenedentota bacterium]
MEAKNGQLAWLMTAPSGDSEESAWVSAAKTGDLSAFDALLVRHEALVLRTALRLLGNREDAQDAAQEVFLRLFRHFDRFDGSRPLEPWLYRLTVNACRDAARRRMRTAVTLSRVEASATRGTPGAADAGLRREERESFLQRALHTLTERERTAVVLRDLEELPAREVAKAMNCFEVTVRTYLRRARLKMKRFYEAEKERSHDV